VEENEPSANDDARCSTFVLWSLNQSVADFMLRFFGVASTILIGLSVNLSSADILDVPRDLNQPS